MQGYFRITSNFRSEIIKGITLTSPLKFNFGLQCKVQSSIASTIVALESRCNIIIQMVILIESRVNEGLVANPLAVGSLCCMEVLYSRGLQQGPAAPSFTLVRHRSNFLKH
jgi:hypothetical protein